MRVPGPSVAFALCLAAQAAAADGRLIQKRAEFESLVAGRDLTAFAVELRVTPDGTIEGRAFGQPIMGSWVWRDGYFCRVMEVGARVFPENCQTVSLDGTRITFTADRGTGQTAQMTLR